MKDSIDQSIDHEMERIIRHTKLKECVVYTVCMFNKLISIKSRELYMPPKNLDVTTHIISHTKKWPDIN